MNKKNFQVFDKMIHPDFQFSDPCNPNVNSKDEYKACVAEVHESRPDSYYEIVDIIAEAKKVVVQYHWTGTPIEEIAALPPGKKLEHYGIVIYYFDNDQIIKIFDLWDRWNLRKQMGLVS